MTTPSNPSDETQSRRFWRTLILWALLALLVRWLVVEPRWIPSGSMLPTLQLKDRILVEKIRPRISRQQHTSLPLGSIVVFSAPPQLVEAGYDPAAALIKRVVGRPGDQLAVRDGALIRNGEVLEEPWLPEPIGYTMDAVTVAPDQLWVMGDNRNTSLDSHLWGSLPLANVIGTAVWRYWPPVRFGPIRISANEKNGAMPEAALRSGP